MRRTWRPILPIAIVFLLLSVISALPSAAATLKVSSFPSGAQVIVDGVNTGKVTPMNISVPEGDHVVTVQIPGSGWNPDTRTVTIVSGNNDLSVTLLPTPTPGPPGPQGIQGPKGEPGKDGMNGLNGIDGTSATFVGYFAGDEHGCPNGGATFAAGGVEAYVCNGQPATAGAARPDGPCFDNINRYVDCGNGTVTDTVTGLIWLKQADCFEHLDWAASNEAAAALVNGQCGLTDKSSLGDWRLATKGEWSATIAHAVALGCKGVSRPSLTDDAGTACYGDGLTSSFTGLGPNLDLQTGFFWSSSTVESFPDRAWAANLLNGILTDAGVATPFAYKGINDNFFRMWPVRGGPR